MRGSSSNNPSIAVVGVSYGEEASTLSKYLSHNTPHDLMIMVLANNTTLRNLAQGHPNLYPKLCTISNIFAATARGSNVRNVIQYEPASRGTLLDELRQMSRHVGPDVDGFQINHHEWQSPDQIGQYVNANPTAYMSLRICHRALAFENFSPRHVVARLLTYGSTIRNVTIAGRWERGVAGDILKSLDYVTAIREKMPAMGISIAPEMMSYADVDLLTPVLAQFPDISWEAQRALRTPYPDDKLDLVAACRYVSESYKASAVTLAE